LELINDAKNNSFGIDLLTDELLGKLDKPKIFIEKFVAILLNNWNEEKNKKYLRLILIEQFRSNKDSDISLNMLINDIINIWEMIFTQMINFKVIKNYNPKIIAEEFVYPLFMLRLQFLTEKFVNWDELNQKSNSHIQYFWNSIKK